MFNVEEAIADWREQMLAAGIKTPVPLDELEIHLREEIERQLKSGLNCQRAFEIAAKRIGRRHELKAEFAKTDGLFDWLGNAKPTKINYLLGTLWLAQCVWFMITIASSPAVGQLFYYFPQVWVQIRFALVCLTTFSLAGAVGSILLIRGAKLGTSIIRIIALLELVECVLQDKSFILINTRGVELSVFCLMTLWFLRPKKVKSPVSAAN